MIIRTLGSEGLVSSAIGLGTRAFTGIYGKVTKHECLRVIRLALDMGITLFDTADHYALGEIERWLGEALSGRRDEALIATCGGIRGAAREPAVIDGSPDYLAAACEASLRRLGTDHVDLFYLAHVDPYVSVEDSVGKLGELVAAGKIRYLGLYAPAPDQLRRAHETHPISVLATEYSLLQRSAEAGSLALAAELGIGVVACRPLASGLLTGNSRALASRRDQAALQAAQAEAAGLDLGLARLALAWLLARRDDVVPVPSTRNPAHIEMNASVPSIKLSTDTYSRLGRAFLAR
jgi:aryl-alcohol dehydrogenase-like predicted oxidoreductase